MSEAKAAAGTHDLIKSLHRNIGSVFLGRPEVVQPQFTLGHRLQRLVIELGQVADDPLVDLIGQQQHLDTVFAEDLEVRAGAGGFDAVSGDVVDGLLAFAHPRHVVGQ